MDRIPTHRAYRLAVVLVRWALPAWRGAAVAGSCRLQRFGGRVRGRRGGNVIGGFGVGPVADLRLEVPVLF